MACALSEAPFGLGHEAGGEFLHTVQSVRQRLIPSVPRRIFSRRYQFDSNHAIQLTAGDESPFRSHGRTYLGDLLLLDQRGFLGCDGAGASFGTQCGRSVSVMNLSAAVFKQLPDKKKISPREVS